MFAGRERPSEAPEPLKELAFIWLKRREKLLVRDKRGARVGRGGMQAPKPLEEKLPAVGRQLLPGVEGSPCFLALLGAELGEAARAVLEPLPLLRRQLAESRHALQQMGSLVGRERIKVLQVPSKAFLRARRQGGESIVALERLLLRFEWERGHAEEDSLPHVLSPAAAVSLKEFSAPLGRLRIEFGQPLAEAFLRRGWHTLEERVLLQRARLFFGRQGGDAEE